MSDKEILALYSGLVPFLASTFGQSCEIVLHDLTDTDQSVIAIENGFNSGRAVGSPNTDLAQRFIDDGEYLDKDFLSNYSGLSKGANFVSSTYFIKNEGRLIGMLCINRNTGALAALDTALEFFKKQNNLLLDNTEMQENLEVPVVTMLQNMVSRTISDSGLVPEHMSMRDKVAIVHRLQEQGVMKMKGAVCEIAAQLNISEPTVYRYMNKRA